MKEARAAAAKFESKDDQRAAYRRAYNAVYAKYMYLHSATWRASIAANSKRCAEKKARA